MTLSEQFLSQLEREADRSRRALEQVPEGRSDWKPHEKSMAFGYLATLVATMPSWITMGITKDELDLKPPDGTSIRPESMTTAAEYVRGHDKAVAEAKAALEAVDEARLADPWRLKVAGQVVMETPRRVMLSDTFLHLAHHRGQMTVYLRLMGAKVPALYGPSADDRSF